MLAAFVIIYVFQTFDNPAVCSRTTETRSSGFVVSLIRTNFIKCQGRVQLFEVQVLHRVLDTPFVISFIKFVRLVKQEGRSAFLVHVHTLDSRTVERT